jgi:hypothetical protein
VKEKNMLMDLNMGHRRSYRIIDQKKHKLKLINYQLGPSKKTASHLIYGIRQQSFIISIANTSF